MLPRLVYIGGHGRSGSTILEQTLHRTAEITGVGEFRHVFDRGLRQNQLCACGAPFRQCEFWASVFSSPELAPIRNDPDEVLRLQFRVDRPDRVLKVPLVLPRLMRGITPADIARLEGHFGTALARAAHLAEATVVIDSSKVPSYGGLLANVFHERLALLHVIRDPRAVAFSLQRRRTRPDVVDRQEMLPTYAPLRTAVRWCLVNLLIENLARRVSTAVRVRYEDFATAPHDVTRRLFRELNLPGQPDAAFDGSRGNPKPYHSVSGNPARLAQGPVQIRFDTEWTQRMEPSVGRRVTLLTLPLLLRYRYPVAFRAPQASRPH